MSRMRHEGENGNITLEVQLLTTSHCFIYNSNFKTKPVIFRFKSFCMFFKVANNFFHDSLKIEQKLSYAYRNRLLSSCLDESILNVAAFGSLEVLSVSLRNSSVFKCNEDVISFTAMKIDFIHDVNCVIFSVFLEP